MEIREATLADIPVMARSGKTWHDQMPYAEFLEYNENGLAESLYDALGDGKGRAWILWDEEKLVGLTLGHVMPNFYNPVQYGITCAFVAILPQYQAQGWGTKFRAIIEQWATEIGGKFACYSGPSGSWPKLMARAGYKEIEVTVIKRIE